MNVIPKPPSVSGLIDNAVKINQSIDHLNKSIQKIKKN